MLINSGGGNCHFVIFSAYAYNFIPIRCLLSLYRIEFSLDLLQTGQSAYVSTRESSSDGTVCIYIHVPHWLP